MTVAEYMREVLAHPLGGFYAAKGGDAIGRQGHFVTSPEISSLFGEVRCRALHRIAEPAVSSRLHRPGSMYIAKTCMAS